MMICPAISYRSSRQVAMPTGVALLLSVVVSYILTALTLACGVTLLHGGWIWPCSCAVAFAAALVWWDRDVNWRSALTVAGTAMAVWGVALLLALIGDDYSFDGNFYHQEIIVLLLNGWNPFDGATPSPDASPWAMHYAKAMEIAAASVCRTLGAIEGGKSINIVLASGVMLIAWSTLREMGLARTRALAVTAAAACSPVMVGQLMTYYVDWVKYALLIADMVLVWRMLRHGSKADTVLLSLVTVLAAGVKFNIFFEQGLAMAVAIVWLLAVRERLAALWVTMAAIAGALVGGAVIGWHPYVTNFLSAGHPLYPLLGAGTADIMTGNTPDTVAGLDRISAMAVSLFTPAAPTYDMRLGGFGPLMPLLLGVCVWCVYRYRMRLGAARLYVLAFIAASCLIFAQSWWARYVCQLWLMIPVTLLALYLLPVQDASGRGARLAARILLWGAVATGVTAAGVAAAQCSLTTYPRRMLYSLVLRKDSIQPVRMGNHTAQAIRHFTERGIRVVSIPDSVLSRSHGLMFFGKAGAQSLPAVALPDTIINKLSHDLPSPMSNRIF